MAELSLPWDGTSTGDAGTYTEDEWRDVLRSLSGGGGAFGSANVAVVGGLLNSIKPSSPGNDQIKADTGYAIVDGTVYKNTAAVTKTMTTPSVGTTGKRLVLQKGWTAQTIRIAVISSSDGTASIPSLTQSDATTWEVPLCSFTHATSGVIAAVTDEREFTNSGAIVVSVDGGGAVITTGIVNIFVPIPRPLHIYGWELLAGQSGAVKIDVWSDTYANYPPTNVDSIAGSDEPEITASGTKAQNLNIATGSQWTTELVAKSNLRFNVDSVATIEAATLILYVAG